MLANATELKEENRQQHAKTRAELKEKLSGAALEKALEELERNWRHTEADRKQHYIAHATAKAVQALDVVGLPAIIRPSFTLGGTGVELRIIALNFMKLLNEGLKLLLQQKS